MIFRLCYDQKFGTYDITSIIAVSYYDLRFRPTDENPIERDFHFSPRLRSVLEDVINKKFEGGA